ncbi:MAG TPA: DUF3253 domain-containing protein [Leptolyngbyaceae cyanobacterium M65_K2018_010]|nr:DUF3253 domain-containing protein [Leptolyngbyaceae cyanobacterium M65_K2018_010]
MTTALPGLRETLLRLVEQRGPGKTLCPSEVARALDSEHWRDLMPAVRALGTQLAEAGAIAVFQKGQRVDPKTARGPIRYGLPTEKGG